MAAGPVVTLERAWRALMQTMSARFVYDYDVYRKNLWVLNHLTRKR